MYGADHLLQAAEGRQEEGAREVAPTLSTVTQSDGGGEGAETD